MSIEFNWLAGGLNSSSLKRESVLTSNFDIALPRKSFRRESDSMVNDEELRVKRNVSKNLTVKPAKRSRFAKFFQQDRQSKVNEIGKLISGLRRNKPHTVLENICSRLLSSQKLNFINPFNYFDKNVEPKMVRHKSAHHHSSLGNIMREKLKTEEHFSSLFTYDKIFNFRMSLAQEMTNKKREISSSCKSKSGMTSIKSEAEDDYQNTANLRRGSQVDSSNKVLDLWRSKTIYNVEDEEGIHNI